MTGALLPLGLQTAHSIEWQKASRGWKKTKEVRYWSSCYLQLNMLRKEYILYLKTWDLILALEIFVISRLIQHLPDFTVFCLLSKIQCIYKYHIRRITFLLGAESWKDYQWHGRSMAIVYYQSLCSNPRLKLPPRDSSEDHLWIRHRICGLSFCSFCMSNPLRR